MVPVPGVQELIGIVGRFFHERVERIQRTLILEGVRNPTSLAIL